MTLERAKIHLDAWYNAELAVSTGQSYSIGSRSLTRANLSEIREQIKYWEDRVAQLRGKKRRKAMRYVPRDL
ncbi:DUF6148 family protein [Bacillus badius]|nr:DUF6148 family protein [Bacillus badius]